MSPDYLIAMASRLDCHYRNDHCDKHLREKGFTRCDNCRIRDEAQRLDKAALRPRR